MSASLDDLPKVARLKIERARRHIEELRSEVAAYLASRPMRLMVRQRREPPEKVLAVERIAPIPDDFSMLIGDAVHNLRAALDLFAYSLVGDLASNPDQIYFPFSKGRESADQTIRMRQMHLAGEDVVSAIASLECFPGGNRWLHGLHLLDIADKHKLIIATGRAAQLSADEVRFLLPEVPINGPGNVKFLTQDDVIARVVFTINRQQRRGMEEFAHEAHIQPAFTICFAQGGPLEGEEVLPALDEMSNEVVRAIRDVTAAKAS